MEGFGDRHEAGLLLGFDVHAQIAIGHLERIAQIGERKFGRGGQEGHDGQPSLFVNNAVELEKWLWVHVSFLRFSVKNK